jgi:hypothetical protein
MRLRHSNILFSTVDVFAIHQDGRRAHQGAVPACARRAGKQPEEPGAGEVQLAALTPAPLRAPAIRLHANGAAAAQSCALRNPASPQRERERKYYLVADHFFFPGFFGATGFLRGGLAGSFFTASSKSLSTRDV